jgi:hypothetical protein
MSYSNTYEFTGEKQSVTIPHGVNEVHVELHGASGGKGDFGGEGGLGAMVSATIHVVENDVLNLYVGGKGIDGLSKTDATVNTIIKGGFNGGGSSGGYGDPGGSGGGASDIRLNSDLLEDRIIVAGGGGGGGSDPEGGKGGSGGNGGEPTGFDGKDDINTGNQIGGKGGTLTVGGLGGRNDSYKDITWGQNGSLGKGGNGGFTDSPTFDSGGGGGGGYYGGGGGGGSNQDSPGDAAGGGGGSSYITDKADNPKYIGGINNGNGKIIISYTIPSWICFRANTMIQTDTGEVPIQLLKAGKHKIRGDKIVGITKTIHNDNEIVKISKDALFENVPNQDLYLSKQHQVIIHGKYIDAVDLVNYNTITLIPYEDEVLYNVLMNNHQVIKANNTSVETLDPRSEVARLFKKYVWKSDKKKKTVKTIKK